MNKRTLLEHIQGTAIMGERTGGNGLDSEMKVYITYDQMVQEGEKSASSQKITPELLYRLDLPKNVEIETPRIINIREKIHKSMNYLNQALEVKDEIERESLMNLFAENIFELALITKVSKNFKDAICLVQTAVEAQRSNVYDRQKILTLKKIMELIRDNISLDEETLDKCFDLLEASDFDTNAPLAEIDFAL